MQARTEAALHTPYTRQMLLFRDRRKPKLTTEVAFALDRTDLNMMNICDGLIMHLEAYSLHSV